MADSTHIEILKRGADIWNEWRIENPDIIPDLSGFNMTFSWKDCPDLNGINLSNANLSHVYIYGPDRDWPDETAPQFKDSDFRNADLSYIDCWRTSFNNSNFEGACLKNGKFISVGFTQTNLRGANLQEVYMRGVNLERALLIQTNIKGASLVDCSIYGASTWDVEQDIKTITKDLLITDSGRIYSKEKTRKSIPILTVDGIEVAQFIYLILNNPNLRSVLNVVTTKVVLILGRFTEERKKVLDTMRERLREFNYIPILFDFEGSHNRDLTEAISTLAHLSKFIIADITEAKSIPQELYAIIPNLPSLVVQPILAKGYTPYAMFEHFQRYPWVMPIFCYDDEMHLIKSLKSNILATIESNFNKSKT